MRAVAARARVGTAAGVACFCQRSEGVGDSVSFGLVLLSAKGLGLDCEDVTTGCMARAWRAGCCEAEILGERGCWMTVGEEAAAALHP